MSKTDSPPRLPRAARGPRPVFFDDAAVDKLLSMNVALLTELLTARERIDTLERLLEGQGILRQSDIEDYKPDETVDAEREAWRERIANHVFYRLQQDGERIRLQVPETLDEV